MLNIKIVVVPNRPEIITPTVSTPDPDRSFSVLLLGFGGPGHEGPFLTDSIILARVNPKLESVDLISVPRDLWVSLPISDTATHSAKINSFYTVGLDNRRYPEKYPEFTGPAGGESWLNKLSPKLPVLCPIISSLLILLPLLKLSINSAGLMSQWLAVLTIPLSHRNWCG